MYVSKAESLVLIVLSWNVALDARDQESKAESSSWRYSKTNEIDDGVIYNNSEISNPIGKRYIVINDKRANFFQAWRACMHLGLRLAAINSREDNLALMAALQHVGPHQQGPWYIAGTDLGEDGKYVWITTDQSVGFGTGYSNWGVDQPDNYLGGEHCIEVGAFKGTHWNDVDCNTNRPYICERVEN